MYTNQMRSGKTQTETRFLQKKSTQIRPPDSRLPSDADSARPHHRRHHTLVYVPCCQSRYRQNWRTCTVNRDGHWLLYLSWTCVFISVYLLIDISCWQNFNKGIESDYCFVHRYLGVRNEWIEHHHPDKDVHFINIISEEVQVFRN